MAQRAGVSSGIRGGAPHKLDRSRNQQEPTISTCRHPICRDENIACLSLGPFLLGVENTVLGHHSRMRIPDYTGIPADAEFHPRATSMLLPKNLSISLPLEKNFTYFLTEKGMKIRVWVVQYGVSVKVR